MSTRSADPFFKVCGSSVVIPKPTKSRRVESAISVKPHGWLAQTRFVELRSPEGTCRPMRRGRGWSMTRPCAASQTPQNGGCASPIFIKFRGPEAHHDRPKEQVRATRSLQFGFSTIATLNRQSPLTRVAAPPSDRLSPLAGRAGNRPAPRRRSSQART